MMGVGGDIIELVDARVHPGFAADSLANDLLLLFLKRPAAAAPVPLIPQPLDASFIGKTTRVVGFGVTAPEAGDGGRKRQGNSSLLSYTATTLTINPTPSQ